MLMLHSPMHGEHMSGTGLTGVFTLADLLCHALLVIEQIYGLQQYVPAAVGVR